MSDDTKIDLPPSVVPALSGSRDGFGRPSSGEVIEFDMEMLKYAAFDTDMVLVMSFIEDLGHEVSVRLLVKKLRWDRKRVVGALHRLCEEFEIEFEDPFDMRSKKSDAVGFELDFDRSVL